MKLWCVLLGLSSKFSHLPGRLCGVHGDLWWCSEGRSADEGRLVANWHLPLQDQDAHYQVCLTSLAVQILTLQINKEF